MEERWFRRGWPLESWCRGSLHPRDHFPDKSFLLAHRMCPPFKYKTCSQSLHVSGSWVGQTLCFQQVYKHFIFIFGDTAREKNKTFHEMWKQGKKRHKEENKNVVWRNGFFYRVPKFSSHHHIRGTHVMTHTLTQRGLQKNKQTNKWLAVYPP